MLTQKGGLRPSYYPQRPANLAESCLVVNLLQAKGLGLAVPFRPTGRPHIQKRFEARYFREGTGFEVILVS